MIASHDNSLLRHVRAVRDGKVDNLVFVEGLRLSEEVLRSGLRIEAVVASDELVQKEKSRPLMDELRSAAERFDLTSEKLLGSISHTKTPQGLVVLAARPASDETHFRSTLTEEPSLVLVMHRINNPVNVGAMLRTTEAAGATGAIATRETSDPFSAKSLRGAMGSAFRLPIWHGPEYKDVIEWLKQRDITAVCADLRGSKSYAEVDWTKPCAIIMGPESSGLSMDEIAVADDSVRITMRGSAESLNVAVAAGIILYEAARQRS